MKRNLLLTLLLSGVFLGSMLIIPEVLAQAEKPGPGYKIVTCTEDCGFKEFIELVNRVINLLLYFALTLAVISFMYAGFLLLFSGGNESKLSDAKSIFWKVLTGIIIAFLAWTIVHFVLGLFGVSDGYSLLE